MKAALLPAGADPFLVTYWLRHYRTWASEVDELRVQVSGLMGDSLIRDYLVSEAAQYPNVVLTFSDPRVDHGEVIARLLSETPADLVVLCEDDAFVRRPGAISEAFARIESGETDICASPRATGTPEVVREAARAFGWQIMDTSEAGSFMWPCFLFARKADLLRADNFSVKHWQPGELVKGLGYTVKAENDADTFADASIQLQGLGLRVHWTPQYRADEHLMSGWLAADPPWFHVGSLSGSTDYLLGRKDTVDREAWIADIASNPDWAKRFAWWDRVSATSFGLGLVRMGYRNTLQKAVDDSGMPPSLMADWHRRFDGYVTW